MKIISILNQKGGVAKTTTATNLSYELKRLGKRVLLVDMDPQGNATIGSGVFLNDEDKEISHTLCDDEDIRSIIKNTDYYDLAPAGLQLAGAELKMINMMARESVLKSRLETVRENYDYVVIDCAPSLSILTLNALVASKNIFIPVVPDIFSVVGINQLLDTIEAVKGINQNLELGGVFFTKYDVREKITADTREKLSSYLGDKIMNTVIRVNADIKKAQSEFKPVSVFNEKCNGTQDYKALAKEILKQVGDTIE